MSFAALDSTSGQSKKVAVLFARSDSLYRQFPECDVWDAERDARRWEGNCPVIAHPTCRAWGRLRHFARPCHDEPALAILAVHWVRKHGGVVEHPAHSKLWDVQGLEMPRPIDGIYDRFGGWTLPIVQSWWGHRAEKATWLYIVGCSPSQLPGIPLMLGDATHVIARNKKGTRRRPVVTKKEREATPLALCKWLVSLAQSCKKVQP